ncbi:lipid-binding SYLF domain-containing protein [Allorhodopirellula solitaria]|nr:lipid-binding SYLF domain-containing protein [Allorhodopirellula solitaria]
MSRPFLLASVFFISSASFLPAVPAQQPPAPLVPQPVLSSGPTSTEAGVVNEAAVVLQELTSKTTTTGIPKDLLASAEAIAIVPHFIRGAFVVGFSGGHGVLVQRDANRQWQAPEFIKMFGGSFGWQAGVQATDLVLVFRSARSLQNIQQGKVTLGVDASAAAGPVGRTAGAATDAALKAEILTYSRARGLYAGVSLGGSSLQLDIPATQRYYQITPSSPGVVPPSAIALVNELNAVSTTVAGGSVESLRPADAGNPAVTASPLEGEALEQRSRTISQIAASIAALQKKVDAQWQEYLVLPASWKVPSSVTPEEIQAVVVRYERVASNPQFSALSSQPEFVETLRLLRQLAVDTAAEQRLNLPPPPAQF